MKHLLTIVFAISAFLVTASYAQPSHDFEITVVDADGEKLDNAAVAISRTAYSYQGSTTSLTDRYGIARAKVTSATRKFQGEYKITVTKQGYISSTQTFAPAVNQQRPVSLRFRLVKSSNCSMAGSWHNVVENLGDSDWKIQANGKASEDKMGKAHGTATLSGKTLKIHWWLGENEESSPYVGDYVINLASGCKSGTGSLNWTKKPTGEQRGPSFTVTEFKKTDP